MARKIFNPLFDTKENTRETIVAMEPVKLGLKAVAHSPISGKPMRKISCDGISAWYDEPNRLVLPVMKD